MDTNKWRAKIEEKKSDENAEKFQNFCSPNYPKGLPLGSGAAIRLRRCFLCDKLRYTNIDSEKFNCETCKIHK